MSVDITRIPTPADKLRQNLKGLSELSLMCCATQRVVCEPSAGSVSRWVVLFLKKQLTHSEDKAHCWLPH